MVGCITRKADQQDLDVPDTLYCQNMKNHVEKHCQWDPHVFVPILIRILLR